MGNITVTHNMLPPGAGTASLDTARAHLSEVQGRMFRVAAVARARGVLAPDGVQRVRSLMKAGATPKVTTAVRAAEVATESERFLLELVALVGEESLAWNPASNECSEGDLATIGAVDESLPHTTDLGGTTVAPEVDAEAVQGAGPGPSPAKRGRPRAPESAGKRRALAELSSAEISEAASRHTLVTAMQQGATAAEALRLIGRENSQTARRWAQRVYQRYVSTGGRLYDGRHTPQKRDPKVLTTAVAATAEMLWLHHRGAAGSAIRRRIGEMITELGEKRDAGGDISYHPLGQAMLEGSVELPSVPTLYRFFESLGPDKAKIREVGFAEWVRQTRTITKEQPWALHANERWEIDHTLLDSHVKTIGPDGMWRQSRPWLTAIIDVYSRAVMAIVLSLRAPDAFTTAIALRRAILPKADWPAWTPRGLPLLLVLDNGKDFRASDVATSVNALGIRQEFCAPHTPDQKPHIERFFGTLTRNLLPMLPGYVNGVERGATWAPTRIGRLLTVPQLRAHVERWIVEFYHQEEHHTTRRRPVELWEESVPGLHVPPREDLDVLLLQTDERKVSRGFIRFTPLVSNRKRLYYAPALLGANGQRVLLRYNPDDLASVMVYDALTRERLGEAWDVNSPLSPYSKESIRQQSKDFRIRMGMEVKPLIQRGEQYHEHIAKHDRVGTKRSAAAEAEMRDIRAAADAEIIQAEAQLQEPGFRTAAQCAADEDAAMEREMKERMRAAARANRPGSVVTATINTLPHSSPAASGPEQVTKTITRARLA